MKKYNKIIATIAVLVLGIASVVSAVTFTDTNGHWAEANINDLASKNVINGYEDGTFRPNGAIKKGEFIKLLMAAVLPDEVWDKENTTYNHWAGTYINTAEREKVIQKGVITEENANDEITRAEVVELLGICDIVVKGNSQKSKRLDFYDVDEMTDMQQAMLKHCVSVGYITGYNDSTFKPENILTRAEVATIIARFMAE